jgi:hypothetical protein
MHAKSIARTDSLFVETQAFESQSFGDHSDASSIARFPSFHFNMHTLTSLSQLAGRRFKGSMKVNVVLAVLEVEGPDTIRIKKGADAGREVSILKMILGDEDGTVVKLTAWREIADEWGGSGKAVATKRGDIVHIESQLFILMVMNTRAQCSHYRCQRNDRPCNVHDTDSVAVSQIAACYMLSHDALYSRRRAAAPRFAPGD